ncbi:MAG: hypothetical protein OEY74_00045 [Gammaproteobacteria bacterium]|nr:hypothetical protein [Gammaproteobacteria bacterium]
MMRYAALTILLVALLQAPAQARAEHSLVLIASKDSSLQDVNAIDLRKLYLGFTVVKGDGRPIRAISNFSSPDTWEIFLQDVMGMSERSYNRRLLTLTLQSGRARPTVHKNLAQLLDHLKSDHDAISFAWSTDIEDRDDIKVLRVLWHH